MALYPIDANTTAATPRLFSMVESSAGGPHNPLDWEGQQRSEHDIGSLSLVLQSSAAWDQQIPDHMLPRLADEVYVVGDL